MSDVLSELRRDLAGLKAADIDAIEGQVKAARFSCVRCQKCCKGAYGDNTVAVSPGEIRSIMKATGLTRADIAMPAPVGDYDTDGVFHSFGWGLRKKQNGDCVFLDDAGLCSIYACRPWICRTYPFSHDRGRVETYECDGLCSTNVGDTRVIATTLIGRSIAETEEAIGMLERFEGFTSATPPDISTMKYVVHDSEGSHSALLKGDGSFELY